MLIELIAIGSFWFWGLILLEIVGLFALMKYENGLGASISVIAFIAALQLFSNFSVLGWVWAHPWQLTFGITGYLLAGVVWSMFKWYLFTSDALEKYYELRDDFLKAQGEKPGKVPARLKAAWKLKMENGWSFEGPPSVRDHKTSVTRWMAFWPISAVQSFLGDFVYRVFQLIFRRLVGRYQAISDRMFDKAGYMEDIGDPPNMPEDSLMGPDSVVELKSKN